MLVGELLDGADVGRQGQHQQRAGDAGEQQFLAGATRRLRGGFAAADGARSGDSIAHRRGSRMMA